MISAKNLRYDIESLVYNDSTYNNTIYTIQENENLYDIESLEYFTVNDDYYKDLTIEITDFYQENDDFIIEIKDIEGDNTYFNKIRENNYSELFDNPKNEINEYSKYLNLLKFYLFKLIF
jgi:guanylate kinase